MKFLNNLERKYGRYAIPNIMRYVLGLYAIGTVIGILVPQFYAQYLALDIGMVLKGQVWRLVTFIMAPYTVSLEPISILFFFIELSLYYMIGNALEQAWGSFRFNLYLISGILFNIVAAVITYFVTGFSYGFGLEYIFQSMFLAFAVLYPNVQLMLYMVIPIKVKWIGYLYAGIMGYEIITCFLSGKVYYYVQGFAMMVAMANFFLFFLWSWKSKNSFQNYARRRQFKRQARTMATNPGEPRHRCAICGRTEQDHPDLEFRFCSKCEGNFEYCKEHLFTHEHVKKH